MMYAHLSTLTRTLVTMMFVHLHMQGNREFYQNCADIKVDGTGATFTGPPLSVLNLPGYPTMPEGGESPFDAQGVPNNRYGEGATEGKTSAKQVTNEGKAVAGAPVSATATVTEVVNAQAAAATLTSNTTEPPSVDNVMPPVVNVTILDPVLSASVARFLDVLSAEMESN